MQMLAHADNVRLLSQPAHLSAARFHLVSRRIADELTYGTDPSRFFGSGIDYAQSRPMNVGDSVRSIDWRVTARTGRLHVKDYEASKRLGVYVLVDTSASMNVRSTELSKHDVAVWAAAAVAQLALNRRSPVSIESCGERDVGAKPTSSRSQVTQWIESLRRGTVTEGTRIVQSLRRIETLARHRSIIVVISDLYEAGAVDAIKRVAQRHDMIVLRPLDPAERGELRAGFVRVDDAEGAGGGGRGGMEGIATGRQRWFGDEGGGIANGLDEPVELTGAGIDIAVLATDRPLMP
ncbi:MAG: DUF58 domain-containing protein, partial [Phycisphaerales bacterium]|nr:DUF58 domain-containing protein [Phycisphaerales bacterium]